MVDCTGLIAKVRQVYPDRTKRLRIRDYFLLTAIDFGWLIILFYIASAFVMPWHTHQILWFSIKLFLKTGVVILGQIILLKLFMAMSQVSI